MVSASSLSALADQFFPPLDIAVFVSVIVQAQIFKRMSGTSTAGLLNTVSRDAMVYFAVISSSHLVVVIMFATTRVWSFLTSLGFETI